MFCKCRKGFEQVIFLITNAPKWDIVLAALPLTETEDKMNLYQIHYTDSEGGNLVGNFTERNEASARKNFKTSCKGCVLESVELIREGVGATKQQERDTLAAIMQMVEELGPESYLKTAFAGCFEDAENNIEDDAAYSMKERYEKAQEDAKYFQDVANTFSSELEAAREKIYALEEQFVGSSDVVECIRLIIESRNVASGEMAEFAEKIVKYAENSDSKEFREAVVDHREIGEKIKHLDALSARLEDKVKAGK